MDNKASLLLKNLKPTGCSKKTVTSNFSLMDLKITKKWCNPVIFGKLIPDHLCLFNLFNV